VHARFQPEAPPGERQALASRYGLPADGFVFYPAHPWPHKNHRRLFRALRLLTQRRGRRIPIVCTGTLGDESRILRRIAAAAGLPPEQLHDLGFVSEEEMPALYRAARLLVFPSLFEGFGMPVLEAMASGCPVACADTPALKELGGDAVAVFTGQSEMEMVEVLGRLWLDARARARLAESGLRRAVQFRWPAVVPQVLTAYRQAAAAPASRVGARVASGGAAR
jgi:glycosyltransferase involved in cell wall biosynthesis